MKLVFFWILVHILMSFWCFPGFHSGFIHFSGDFIVLIESGLSIPKAITLNFLSALTAFAGLFIGLAAIAIDNAVEILLAVTAAIFLYIAWIEMVCRSFKLNFFDLILKFNIEMFKINSNKISTALNYF